MDRSASQGSLSGAAIQASPMRGTSATLLKDLKSNTCEPPDDVPMRCTHVSWSMRHAQWVLAVYATGVLIATSHASHSVYDLGESFKDIIEALQLDASSAALVDRAVRVALLVSWLLAGGACFASAISIVWKFWNAAKRERFKHLAKEGEIGSRTAGTCMRFNALRVLLITVHVFCLLTCVWFVVMLCILMALLVLLVVGRQSAVGALDFVQTAEKNANTFTSDIFVRIEEYEKSLTNMTATISGYCGSTGFCPPVITDTQRRMLELSEEMGGLLEAVEETEVCPSASCINMDLFWFLEASGCVCASDTLHDISRFGSTAKHHCRSACVAIGVAFLCALMMLSKTAMNLKSHVKDDAWMRRVRRIFMKLQERGVRLPSSETESGLFDSELSREFTMHDLYNAALPPALSGHASQYVGPGTNPRGTPVGTPRRGAALRGDEARAVSSPTKAALLQIQKGVTNRNYLGIEPPVSLGSDAGGSGPLSMGGSRRLIKPAADGGSGLLLAGPSGLARENSAASIASSSGQPSGGEKQSQQLRPSGGGKTEGKTLGEELSGRMPVPGHLSSEGDSGSGARTQGWVLGAMRAMCSCIDGEKPPEDDDGELRAIPFKGGMHGDVASGVTALPPQTSLADTWAAVATGADVDAQGDELPVWSSGEHSSLSSVPSGGGGGGSPGGSKAARDGAFLQRPAGSEAFETPPPVGNTELSVIHEAARESSMTMTSAHGSFNERHMTGPALGHASFNERRLSGPPSAHGSFNERRLSGPPSGTPEVTSRAPTGAVPVPCDAAQAAKVLAENTLDGPAVAVSDGVEASPCMAMQDLRKVSVPEGSSLDEGASLQHVVAQETEAPPPPRHLLRS